MSLASNRGYIQQLLPEPACWKRTFRALGQVLHKLAAAPVHIRNHRADGLVGAIAPLTALVHACLDIFVARELEQAKEDRTRFLEGALAKGGGLAHKITKVPQPQTLSMVPVAQCDPTISDDDQTLTTQPSLLLQRQFHKWAGHWGHGKTPKVISPASLQRPKPLTARCLRVTAHRFRAFTSVVDTWSPKQIGQLSEQALEALALLLNLFEIFGNFRTHNVASSPSFF